MSEKRSETRTVMLPVRLTVAERDQLRDLAKRKNQSMAAWLRDRVYQHQRWILHEQDHEQE